MRGQIPGAILDPMPRHVLGRVDIRYITLAASPVREEYLIHFEGLRGSRVITTVNALDSFQPTDFLFGPGGIYFPIHRTLRTRRK